jgi:hypothetical protein
MPTCTANTFVNRAIAIVLALEDLLLHDGSTKEGFAGKRKIGIWCPWEFNKVAIFQSLLWD